MRTLRGLGFIAGIAAILIISGSCTKGGSDRKKIGVNQGSISCGDLYNGSLGKSAGAPPNFAQASGTRQFEITGLAPGLGTVEIRLVVSSTDSSLYLAAPGTALGDANSASFYFSSIQIGGDSIIIDDTGVRNAAGAVDSTYTLTDFEASPLPPVFAVCSLGKNADYLLVLRTSLKKKPLRKLDQLQRDGTYSLVESRGALELLRRSEQPVD